MAINPVGQTNNIQGSASSNYYDRDSSQYSSRDEIKVERGGVFNLVEDKISEDDDGEIHLLSTVSVKELLPEHAHLNTNDIRVNFRNFDDRDYVQIYNRHTEDILKVMPREEFMRTMGKAQGLNNSTFQIYV